MFILLGTCTETEVSIVSLAYLNLFIFMMLNLVLASNFLLTFVGWEGVGVCSYLLIGFWYDRKFEGTNIEWTGDAGNKAFIVNRIGDFGFLIAVFLLFVNFGTLEYHSINEILSSGASGFHGTALMTVIGLLIFLGCTGKSAQIPLAVWLPDAMAGPTPVSALDSCSNDGNCWYIPDSTKLYYIRSFADCYVCCSRYWPCNCLFCSYCWFGPE